jgi:hypothetical protein
MVSDADRVDFKQWNGREVARLLALLEAERRYFREIVASIPVPVPLVSADGSVSFANRSTRFCAFCIFPVSPRTRR